MTIQQITRIVDQHGLMVTVVNDRAIASDLQGGDAVDATDFTIEDLALWLGY